MKLVKLHDKTFEISIPNEKLETAISDVATRINCDYRDKETPLFLCILNGAFMFAAELLQNIDFDCEVSFVKLASYSGTCSTGCVQELIGINGDISGRHIIIVEDIVDTGESLDYLVNLLKSHSPASVEIATMLLKPASYKKDIPVRYCGMVIPNDFIVGFGLDYDQLGRNLRDIYKVVDE